MQALNTSVVGRPGSADISNNNFSKCTPKIVENLGFNETHKFTLLVIRDFFATYKLRETLACFTEECKRKRMEEPNTTIWYEICQAIELPSILKEFQDLNNQFSTSRSVLDILMCYLIKTRHLEMKSKYPSTIVCSAAIPQSNADTNGALKEGSIVSTMLKDVGTEKIAPIDPEKVGQLSLHKKDDKKATAISPNKRPKNVVSSFQTTQMKRAMKINHSKSEGSQKKYPTILRPKSSFPKGSTSLNTKDKAKSSLTIANKIKRNRITNSIHTKSLPLLKKEAYEIGEDGEKKPVWQPSAENWIPHNQRMRMMRRDINIVSSTLQEKDQVQRLQQVFREQAKIHDEKDERIENCFARTVKENPFGIKYSMDPNKKRKIECFCCTHLFKKFNLPYRFTYKSIMDFRRKMDPEYKEIHPTLVKPPQCYDRFPVCRFCAQMLKEIDAYRIPPEELRLAKLEEQRKIIQNEKRLKEIEDNRLDPLDFDDYSDVSEDSGSSSDFEDEVDPQALILGIVQTRRHGKRKKRALKNTPAKGLIGKRLAYERFGKESPPLLDSREWNVLEKKDNLFRHKSKVLAKDEYKYKNCS